MQPQHYYTFFMLLSLAVFLLARWLLTKPEPALQQTEWWKRMGLVLAGFIGGALGAKVPFVLQVVVEDNANLLNPRTWISDGKTITTAIVGAYLSIEIAKLLLGVKAKTGDTFAVPLALALAVGRFGCFFNGCCYGVPTDLPWGVTYADGISRHPTQIYEVIFHFSMAVLLIRLTQLHRLQHQRLKLYLICYGIYRFLTEFIRPEPRDLLGLSFYQWVALIIIGAMAAQWKIDARWAGPTGVVKTELAG